jgi:hypothetical protein
VVSEQCTASKHIVEAGPVQADDEAPEMNQAHRIVWLKRICGRMEALYLSIDGHCHSSATCSGSSAPHAQKRVSGDALGLWLDCIICIRAFQLHDSSRKRAKEGCYGMPEVAVPESHCFRTVSANRHVFCLRTVFLPYLRYSVASWLRLHDTSMFCTLQCSLIATCVVSWGLTTGHVPIT